LRRFVDGREAYVSRRTGASIAGLMRLVDRLGYVRVVNNVGRQMERLRSHDPLVTDTVLAAVLYLVVVISVFAENVRNDAGVVPDGIREPGPLVLVTVMLACAPVAVRRRWPLAALVVSSAGVVIHFGAGWPEGLITIVALFLTYSVAAWSPTGKALAGLGAVVAAVGLVGFIEPAGLDELGVLGVLAQFAVVWAIGIAVRHRRLAADARVREAERRADLERESTARVLAEERLRIAQELHDVVAHAMSVIAVQAGVGAHLLDHRPEQARASLEAISATSRGALVEMRRLLGVLRDETGTRSPAPAPSLADLPTLLAEVRSAGVPATLHVEGLPAGTHAGVELSAYRIIQEALTNVIRHAGHPSSVTVTIRHLRGSVAVEIADNGTAVAASTDVNETIEHAGHGLVGMRERVELWGGELSIGPTPDGGYRVEAWLPYGDT
jgi:signal transduction histidine kinase